MKHRSVPNAPPEMVKVQGSSIIVSWASSIILSWGEVPCQHRNGEIIGYAVKYSGWRQTQEVLVMDGRATTIDDLDPLTAEYSIMVAAVNSNGTGQFSEPVTIGTYI